MIIDTANQTTLAETSTSTPAAKYVSRNCRQCGTPLTDPASINEGIGPICRKKANLVLAKEIPAALNNADLLALLGVEYALPTEANVRWQRVFPLLLETAAKVDGVGHDYRQACKDIAYILSFELPTMTVNALLGMVEALGYRTFAAWLRGEVSTSPASVAIDGNFVALTAKRNPAGQAALKSAKIGAFFQGNAWRFPVRNAAAGCAIVAKYWPMVTGVEVALQSAALLTPAPAVIAAPAPTVPAGPVIVLTVKGGETWIKSPFNRAFVDALKSLPRGERLWDQEAAVWVVYNNHRGAVDTLVATHYPNASVVVR